ncbi:MAG: hypothetical protein KatS3mg002_1582 [Candidatus Woesearchaeota archaeon]|nr:MAG: hypothetical protein KatS3mg002_1582 [Candidatus Woesearchaeota archaeon]
MTNNKIYTCPDCGQVYCEQTEEYINKFQNSSNVHREQCWRRHKSHDCPQREIIEIRCPECDELLATTTPEYVHDFPNSFGEWRRQLYENCPCQEEKRNQERFVDCLEMLITKRCGEGCYFVDLTDINQMSFCDGISYDILWKDYDRGYALITNITYNGDTIEDMVIKELEERAERRWDRGVAFWNLHSKLRDVANRIGDHELEKITNDLYWWKMY